MGFQEEIFEEVLTEEKVNQEHKIVVFNDDFNTFDHVIDTLVATCEHHPIQAEQCALIIHYKGKCDVKSGDFNDLKPRCTKILEAGITAEIQ
ncbi:MAG: ATP-dependent Clp protease adaptor ClpS [Bacteroidota bacterium]